ncbi:polysaccharide deacetylase family protein [Deltaproteobacteria bacterium PRO3]|nr:polysaccharide deacetylase family protein [Deltaproteobacteria bacterium PRO3]
MPPLKVYIQVSLIALAGLLLGAFLLWRLTKAIRARRAGAIAGNLAAVTAFAAATFGLCYALIPCFNWPLASYCRGDAEKKWVALTFDDGPNEPYTSQILDILAQKQVPAAFFTVGASVSRSPEVVARMLREGHTVGNHTQTHRGLIALKPEEIRQELAGWERAMAPIGTPAPKLFRAPHGWKSPFLGKILAETGYRLVGWTRGVWDTDRPGEEVLFHRLTARPENGMILLLHDGVEGVPGADRGDLVAVLPKVIDHYRALGFRFVGLPEMMQGTEK